MIDIYKGGIDRENNIGLVRYVLALAVMLAHFNGFYDTEIYFPVSSYHAVGGFFALSGFLIYRSYEKSTGVWNFMKKRARKIFPPYYVIVLGCAFLLIFTVPSAERVHYFSLGWLKYLLANLSFLNFLAPSIPGVFDGEPINGSLWTIKIEWLLYITVPAFYFATKRFKKYSPIKIILLTYFISGIYRLIFSELYSSTGREIFNILSRQFFGQLCYFYSGVLAYMIFPTFKRYKYQILGAALTIVVLNDYIFWYSFFIEPAIVTAIVLAVSFCGKTFNVLNKNNFSYEIYLFHLPVFLLIRHYQKAIGIGNIEAFMLSSAIIVTLSACCWFLLDKRILGEGRKPGSK